MEALFVAIDFYDIGTYDGCNVVGAWFCENIAYFTVL
jgi:hypothetical protein